MLYRLSGLFDILFFFLPSPDRSVAACGIKQLMKYEMFEDDIFWKIFQGNKA